jgi:hypothetical protein
MVREISWLRNLNIYFLLVLVLHGACFGSGFISPDPDPAFLTEYRYGSTVLMTKFQITYP